MKKRRILWTGGWDSTYRLIELSRQDIVVEPVYVSGDFRLSEDNEIKAMYKIMKMLKNHKSTKAKILDLFIIDKNTIIPNEMIKKSYKNIREMMHLGTQYEWLGELGLMYPNIEIGIVLQNPDLEQLFSTKANIIREKDVYRIVKNGTDEDVYNLFSNYYLPLINYTGPDLIDNIIEWGYQDVMKNIWFCHKPFFGKPCGYCKTCSDKMNLGMYFLFPNESLRRKLRYQNPLWRIVYKVKDKLQKLYIKRFK